MFDTIKEFIKFFTSLRGVWEKVKASITQGATPLGITQIIERNIDPQTADTLRRNQHWNDIKQCHSLDEVKDRALGFAKTVPFFEGKNEKEIEEYAFNMGRSLGFLD